MKNSLRGLLTIPLAGLLVLLYTAPAGATLVASVLPGSRSVQLGASDATAFATMINAGTENAVGCEIIPLTDVPAQFLYQTTDPATNALVGTPNTPVDIAAGEVQTFFLAFTPSAPFAAVEVEFGFVCAGMDAAAIIPGVNTLLLSASQDPVPDVIAMAATVSNDGIANVIMPPPADPPLGGSGFFAVSSINVGAGELITVSTDTGAAQLPLDVFLCETDPQTAACLEPPGLTVDVNMAANAAGTFSIFLNATDDIHLSPADTRVSVLFLDSEGATRGSSSVAIQTIPDILGIYTGGGTATSTGCQNPLLNGSIELSSATFTIDFQSGQDYRGSVVAAASLPGFDVQFLVEEFTSRIDSYGNIAGTVNYEVVANQMTLYTAEADFTGTLVGDTITIEMSGEAVSGETCQDSGVFVVTR